MNTEKKKGYRKKHYEKLKSGWADGTIERIKRKLTDEQKKRRLETQRLRRAKVPKLIKVNEYLLSNRGISLDQKQQMYNSQNGRCEICGVQKELLGADGLVVFI